MAVPAAAEIGEMAGGAKGSAEVALVKKVKHDRVRPTNDEQQLVQLFREAKDHSGRAREALKQEMAHAVNEKDPWPA